MDFLLNVLSQEKPSQFIRDNEEEIFKIIPELRACKNFNQNSVWHIYDVYEHILHVVDGVPNNIILRFAALFHDIGKPFVYQEDEKGISHYLGHWDKSKEIFDDFAKKHNFDKREKEIISNLILYHDLYIDKLNDEELAKLNEIFDEDGITMLFDLKTSDLLSQNEKFHYLLDEYQKQKTRVLKMKNNTRR